MRYPIFALSAVAAVTALAPERAYAGDPEADKRIYDAFVKYMQTVPNDKKPQEYKKFLEWYPTNIYAPTVQKEYDVFVAGQTNTTNNNTTVSAPQLNSPPQNTTPENTSTGGFGISTKDPKDNRPVDPMEEAAGVVGATEDAAAAAAALDGVVPVAAEPELIPTQPPSDIVTAPAQLRKPHSYGVGFDLALSAMVGPGVLVDYTTMTSRWTIGGALRAPLFQSVQGAVEARRFLTPEKPLSAYLGGSLGFVAGDIGGILSLVDINFPGTSATTATTFGALGGVQKMKQGGQSYYLELSYQFLVSELGEQAGFPGLSLGYRFFKSPGQQRTVKPYTYNPARGW